MLMREISAGPAPCRIQRYRTSCSTILRISRCTKVCLNITLKKMVPNRAASGDRRELRAERRDSCKAYRLPWHGVVRCGGTA